MAGQLPAPETLRRFLLWAVLLGALLPAPVAAAAGMDYQVFADAQWSTIRLQIGRPAIEVGAQEIPLPSPPRLTKGTTFVPVRGFASAVGLAVDYQAASHTVTVSGPLHNLSLDLGKGRATIDGQVYGGPKPFVNSGVAFAPVRLLAAMLEGQVEYVPETRTILIHRVTINLEVNLPAEVNSAFLPIRVLTRKWLLVDSTGPTPLYYGEG